MCLFKLNFQGGLTWSNIAGFKVFSPSVNSQVISGIFVSMQVVNVSKKFKLGSCIFLRVET